MSAPKTSLVALRSEREKTIEVLSDAFSKDLLDIDQFDHRVDLAHRATSLEALAELTIDLRAAETGDALVPAMDPETREALVAARPRTRTVVAVLGGAERGGEWRVPETLRVVALMGGATIDFRDTILLPGVTTIHVAAMMGGVEIIVPPGVAVECDGAGILGGFDAVERVPAIPDPEAPLLRITGFALMGGLEISTRLPGESARQARKRRKLERKARHKRSLDAHRQKQLRDGS